MILADTCIWVDHFRVTNSQLLNYAARRRLIHHPLVTGELAMGAFSDWRGTIEMLNRLQQAKVDPTGRVIDFIERHSLMAKGVGFVDAHLLATCEVNNHKLWTRDKRLAVQADRLGLLYEA